MKNENVMSGMEKYSEIINLPHKQSVKRPHMSMLARAAQFAPFAALTGYDDAIEETGRLTDERTELSEEALAALNAKFQILADELDAKREVDFTYFVPDETKAGGAYVTRQGVVKRIDSNEGVIVLRDGQKIPMGDVIAIDAGFLEAEEHE